MASAECRRSGLAPLSTGESNREIHVAFAAADRITVQKFFDAAVAAGAEVLHESRVWPSITRITTAHSYGIPTATMLRPSAITMNDAMCPSWVNVDPISYDLAGDSSGTT